MHPYVCVLFSKAPLHFLLIRDEFVENARKALSVALLDPLKIPFLQEAHFFPAVDCAMVTASNR